MKSVDDTPESLEGTKQDVTSSNCTFDLISIDNIKEEPISYSDEENILIKDVNISSLKCENEEGYNTTDEIKEEGCITTDEIKEEPPEIQVCKTEMVCSRCNLIGEEGLVSLLDNCGIKKNTKNTAPKNILEVHQDIFTLLCISENIFFGPYMGLEAFHSNTGTAWILSGGKLTESKTGQQRNWMRHVKVTGDYSKCNLRMFQYNGFLYYRTIRNINCGEKLLVYFDLEFVKSFSDCSENYYYPVEDVIPDVYACIPCCLGFNSEVYLRKHLANCFSCKNKSVQEIVSCPGCKIVWFDSRFSKHHLTGNCGSYSSKARIPQNIKNKLHRCSICHAVYNYKTNLQRHMNIHTTGKQFSCYECDYRSDRKENLKLHIMRMHTKKFACEQCHYVANRRDALKSHITSVHPSNKVCESACTIMNTTHQHYENLNIVAESFKCSICKKQFTEKGSLNRHIRIHTGEKPYKCEHCDYKCSQVGSLSNHIKIHTGEKQHLCQICNKGFLQKYKLKRHLKVHLKQKYGCPDCTYRSISKRAFNKHLKQMHN